MATGPRDEEPNRKSPTGCSRAGAPPHVDVATNTREEA